MDEAELLPDLSPLVVQVWYQDVPDASNPLLLDVLADELNHAELNQPTLNPALPSTGMVVTHESGFHSTNDGEPAWAMTMITQIGPDQRPRVHETTNCAGALVLTEKLFGFLDPIRRVMCVKAVLESLARVTSPVCYWWPNTELVTDMIGEDETLWHGVINIRRKRSDVDSAGWIFDTIGLSLFDMPDLECHFLGLPPGPIAEQLLERAIGMASGQEYVADKDPIIIPSDEGDLWLTAHYGWAKQEPERRVISLVPSPQHALDPPEERHFDDED